MSHPRHLLGLRLETTVAEWLEQTGWTIVGRRVRSVDGGEVDIVALDADGALVAVEVRARRDRRAGSPSESVDRRRIGRMRRTLAAVAGTAPPHRGLRIDLVSAEPVAGDEARWRLRRMPGIDLG